MRSPPTSFFLLREKSSPFFLGFSLGIIRPYPLPIEIYLWLFSPIYRCLLVAPSPTSALSSDLGSRSWVLQVIFVCLHRHRASPPLPLTSSFSKRLPSCPCVFLTHSQVPLTQLSVSSTTNPDVDRCFCLLVF